MKAIYIAGVVLAIVLMIFGALYPIPENKIEIKGGAYTDNPIWSDSIGVKYGSDDDANRQVEASLRSGYMSGVMAMKSICVVGGLLLFFVSTFEYVKIRKMESKLGDISLLLKKSLQCSAENG